MTAEQRAVLGLAGRFYRHESGRMAAMHSELGLTPTRFYQRLNALLDLPAALEHDPITVNRLRRVRATRVRSKSLR